MEDTPSQDQRLPFAHRRTQFEKYRTQPALDSHYARVAADGSYLATFGFGMVGFFRAIVQKANTPESAKLQALASSLRGLPTRDFPSWSRETPSLECRGLVVLEGDFIIRGRE
jgi:hypothetical protein